MKTYSRCFSMRNNKLIKHTYSVYHIYVDKTIRAVTVAIKSSGIVHLNKLCQHNAKYIIYKAVR